MTYSKLLKLCVSIYLQITIAILYEPLLCTLNVLYPINLLTLYEVNIITFNLQEIQGN